MEIKNEGSKAFVYMLTNCWGNVLYIGLTKDLNSRINQHKNRLIPGFTQKYHVNKLVYFEEYPDIESAGKREQELKGKSRVKKNKIVESVNPMWNELSSIFY